MIYLIMDVNSLIIIGSLIILLVVVYSRFDGNMVNTKAYDGRTYLVINDELRKKSADLLARMREKSATLISKLKDKYGNENSEINRLIQRYNPDDLREKNPRSFGTSFTLNKRKIVLCLKKNNGKEMVDENTLFFVLLHEIAHIMTVSVGHEPEFWNNFKFLLAHAISFNLYKYDNYEDPKKYCGSFIDNSPIRMNEVGDFVN